MKRLSADTDTSSAAISLHLPVNIYLYSVYCTITNYFNKGEKERSSGVVVFYCGGGGIAVVLKKVLFRNNSSVVTALVTCNYHVNLYLKSKKNHIIALFINIILTDALKQVLQTLSQ